MSEHRSLNDVLANLIPAGQPRSGRGVPGELLEEIVAAAHAAESERLAAEREAARLRDAFSASPSPVLLTDATGRIIRANRRAGEWLGVEADQLVGTPLAVFVAEDERAAFRGLLPQVASAGEPRSIQLALHSRGRPAAPTVVVVWPVCTGGELLLGWSIEDDARRRAGDPRNGEEAALL